MLDIANSRVKGSGILTIGNKKYPFGNMVNSSFLKAVQFMLDAQKLTGGDTTTFWGLDPAEVKIFTLMSDNADFGFRGIYERLGHVTITNFSTITAEPFKTKIRGAGLITKSGTVRSAGFNVLCNETPISDAMPILNNTRRRVSIRISGLTSVPFTSEWVYNDRSKALYRFQNQSQDVWKIPFDIKTGAIGSPVTVTSSFVYPANGNQAETFSDGYDKVFRFTDNNRTDLIIFDMSTDSLSTVSLSASLPGTASQSNAGAWNTEENALFIPTSTTMIVKVELDGTVTNIPLASTPSFSNVMLMNNSYRIQSNGTFRAFESVQLANNSGWTNNVVGGKRNLIRYGTKNDWFVFGSFNTTTSPDVLTLTMLQEQETATTLVQLPSAIEVEVDTPFSVDYTLEVIDSR